jgi:tryptophan synthase alpha chain
MKSLKEVFERAKSENRAALIGYMPAGFPTSELSARLINAMVNGGVDIVEVGFPYSDPVMDGPVIQQAAETSLRNGTSAQDVLNLVSQIKAPALVMSYWNPIERFGVENFARGLSHAGGVGVITPDLTIEESAEWITTTNHHSINRIYVVAPSTSDARLAEVTRACSGFVYAASLMGVTGARNSVSGSASELVARIRRVTQLPIAVGLGVSNAEQANQVASYADGVIVGSAFIKLVLESNSDDDSIARVRTLAEQLSEGVRRS